MKCIVLTIFLIIAMAMATDVNECIPWTNPNSCQEQSDCCRYLMCINNRCIARPGKIVPGNDDRPIGPGPYPPNIPESEKPKSELPEN